MINKHKRVFSVQITNRQRKQPANNTTCVLHEVLWSHQQLLHDLHSLRDPERIAPDTLPPLCSDTPLSERHGTALPRAGHPSCSWRRRLSSPPLDGFNSSRCPTHSSIDSWSLGFPCHRSIGMEACHWLSQLHLHFSLSDNSSRHFCLVVTDLNFCYWLQKVPLQRFVTVSLQSVHA